MPIVQVNLAISSTEFSRYYRGHASNVICKSVDGRTVQFPAAVLRPYLTHDGIVGNFEIEFSKLGKFIRIDQLSQKP